MNFEINKGLKMPKARSKRYGQISDACRACEIGDSFFVPNARPTMVGTLTKHFKPKIFAGRTITENEISGIRVWRIA